MAEELGHDLPFTTATTCWYLDSTQTMSVVANCILFAGKVYFVCLISVYVHIYVNTSFHVGKVHFKSICGSECVATMYATLTYIRRSFQSQCQ